MNTPRHILFCSEHCLADPVSGAAVSATEMLSLLGMRNWKVSALCGSKLDGASKAPPGDEIRRFTVRDPANAGMQRDSDVASDAPSQDRLVAHHLDWRGVRTRIALTTDAVRPGPGETFPPEDPLRLVGLLKLYEHKLRTRRPDLVLTYGGGWFGRALLKIARKHGVPAVFWLRNTFYERADLFADVTGTIVPSSYTARHYSKTLGLSCEVLFSVVLHDRVHCPVRQPRYLTYVSPMPEKGAYFFARLASEISRLRPDIEILIVEGRGSVDWLKRSSLDVLSQPNVSVIRRVDDPRQFLSVTRAVVFPSAWPETFGRTAVEAMISGIPVISSDRGGLQEIIGAGSLAGGVVLPLPERITHMTSLLATVSEVRPWVDAIARLWDDEEYYRDLSRQAVSSVARFDPDVITDRADVLLRGWAEKQVTPTQMDPVELLAACGYPGDADAAVSAWADLTEADADHLLGPVPASTDA